MKNKNKGITLIALVITIVVLIILATVVISISIGENGIFKRAKQAKEEYANAQSYEKSQISLLDGDVERLTKGNKTPNVLNLSQIEGTITYGTPITITVTENLSNGKIIVNSNDEEAATATIEENTITITAGRLDEQRKAKILVTSEETDTYAQTTIIYNVTVSKAISKIKVYESGNTGTTTDAIMEKNEDSTFKNENLKSSYGKTVHSSFFGSIEGIDWQLFYDDNEYVFLIASDYVPINTLPAYGNPGYSSAAGFLKKNDTDNPTYTHNAAFCSINNGTPNYNNDYVLQSGTIYKNGSASTTITNNPLTSKYLKWVSKYPNSTNANIQAVAFMMDTSKWNNFAGNKYAETFAIGGPTIELFVKSWNAYPGHSSLQFTDYDTMTSGVNYNDVGYKVWNKSNSTWVNFTDVGDLGSNTNMWVICETSKSNGYWLSSPCTSNYQYLSCPSANGRVNDASVSNRSNGFRPLVCIKKASIW